MKLISKFHDYYDGCITTIDPLHVYMRQTEVFEIKARMRDYFNITTHLHNVHDNVIIVGFCGELYVGLRREIYQEFSYEVSKKQPTHFTTYSFEKYHQDGIKFSPWESKERDLLKAKTTLASKPDNKLKALFLEYKTPCFVVCGGASLGTVNIIVNPHLKDYNFASIVDPYTAYQEIQMFVSNELAFEQDKMVKLDDRCLRDKHGFDDKSFKKRKK